MEGENHGKTNCIKKRKEPDSTEDKIALKPIYVSLNGISDTHSINEKIRAEISPFWNSKGMKIAKSVAKGLLKATTKIALDFDEDKKADGNISFNIDLLGMLDPSNEEIKGKRILIFDDIERCAIKTDEIFGYINNFVEHSCCKVILLTDEEKIKVKYQKNKSDIDIDYKDFKEKLIGQTFEVQSEIDTALDLFIKEINKNNQNLYLSKHKDLIKELFVSSKLENLRVFRQALLDFNRLTTYIDKKLTKHENYDEFIKSLLAHFIMIYVEYKTGNENIEGKDLFYLDDLINGKIEGKNYKPISDKFKLKYLTFNFYRIIILNYIKKGTISENELNDEIESTNFFRKTQDWEKLCRWAELEDDMFIGLKDKVWKQFTKGKISDPSVLMHIAGIFMFLTDENLFHKKKEDIVSRSMSILEKIFKNNSTFLKPCIKRYISNMKYSTGGGGLKHLTVDSSGRRYYSTKLPEFIEIQNFSYETVLNFIDRIFADLTKEFFKEITEDSVNLLPSNLYSKLEEALPYGSDLRDRTAIFQAVDGKKLGDRIKSFKNKSIRDFQSFIRNQYSVKLTEYRKNDITCLVDLKKELEKNRDPDKPIKYLSLNALIKELEKCVEKIKGI